MLNLWKKNYMKRYEPIEQMIIYTEEMPCGLDWIGYIYSHNYKYIQ